jgi:hypothetical protein
VRACCFNTHAFSRAKWSIGHVRDEMWSPKMFMIVKDIMCVCPTCGGILHRELQDEQMIEANKKPQIVCLGFTYFV